MSDTFTEDVAQADTSVPTRADGYPARTVPRTKLHSMDTQTDWFHVDAHGETVKVKKPSRGGVVALYGQPHEPFSVATSPTIMFPTYSSETDDEPGRQGYFDRRTGTYYARQGDTLSHIAFALFANVQAVSRVRELNPHAPEVLPPGYPVHLYVED